PLRPRDDLFVRQLVGRRGRPVHEVGDAAAPAKQLALLERGQRAVGEPGEVQGRPEAVAGPAEVVADGARIQAGVDAAEEHFEARREDVADLLAVGGGDLRRARFPGAGHRGLFLSVLESGWANGFESPGEGKLPSRYKDPGDSPE